MSDLLGIFTNKKVIMFGTGEFSQLFNSCSVDPIYYVDNNQNKWGSEHMGKKVYNPSKIKDENLDEIIVIIASVFFNEISEQLEEYGLVKDVHYFDGEHVLLKANSNKFKVIEKFKNIHKGKRVFLIGNGPSLKMSDLDKLKNEYTIASNQIFLAFKDTDWRPTYYSIIDRMSAQNNKDTIKNLNLTKFISHALYPILGNMENSYLVYKRPYEFDERGIVFEFSDDLLNGFFEGASVTYFNLQLAVYMGFEEVYMIGTDYNYPGIISPTKEVKEIHSFEVKYFKADEDTSSYNFTSNYHKAGTQMHVPDLERQYQAFNFSAQHLKKRGIKVFNASRSTMLDTFPLIDFDKIDL